MMAVLVITSRASGFTALVITGHPSFIIPAFSAAISAIVFPSLSVWSREIEAMTVARGLDTTLVESPLPPRPTSSTT